MRRISIWGRRSGGFGPCRIVVIAGDVFDTSRPSYGDYLHFFDGLRRLDRAGIPTYLCTGNHDPYTAWQRDFDELPPSAYMFEALQPSYRLFERDGQPLCLLGGRSYYNQTWSAEEDISRDIDRAHAVAALRESHPAAAQAPFAVGVIHTGLNLDPVKAPADPAALLATDVDYWACGHIHGRQFVPSRENPRIVFPGCIQGRDILETGDRGCCLVTLEEGCAPQVEVVPTASVVWQRVSVDVGSCRTLADVEGAVSRALFRENGLVSCDEMAVRVTLEGDTGLHGTLAQPRVLQDMRTRLNGMLPSFFVDAVIDSTRALRDRDALKREGLFPALAMRTAAQLREDPDGLVSCVQEGFLQRGVAVHPALSRNVERWADDAENLVLDLLADDAL